MLEKYKKLPLRNGVGIVLLNKDNKVFVGRRIDNPINSWQMPQGGIDQNESILDAAKRELEEETGVTNIEVVKELQYWLTYELPNSLLGKIWKGKYRGQNQKWFAMKYLGEDNQIQPQSIEKPEFSDWKWANLNSLIDNIVPFKRKVYSKILEEFKDIF